VYHRSGKRYVQREHLLILTSLTDILVGLTVAKAAGGLGMNLLAFDPYANPSLAASANVEIVDSVDELLAQADFLTLHTPLIASTRGMIGDTELAKMKPTARILNVARGGMIDEVALLSALEAGTIAGAGIDVFTAEPPVAGDRRQHGRGSRERLNRRLYASPINPLRPITTQCRCVLLPPNKPPKKQPH
jgi:lactate dehydrogenase-like 2-hydroxyacid dehydrogenase